MRTRTHSSIGILLLLAWAIPAYAATITITNTPPSDPNRQPVKVTVTDGGNAVPNVCVDGELVGGGIVKLGPTDANGMYTGVVVGQQGVPVWDNATSRIGPCPTSSKSASDHSLDFDASTGTLIYTNATIQSVSYHDMTSISSNNASETIVGATVSLNGMRFSGFDSQGDALFGNASLTISNATGTYLTALYSNIAVASNPVDNTSILSGNTSSFVLNQNLNSRYISEFSQDLLSIPNPFYFIQLGGNLANATNNFTANGSIGLTTDFLGGGFSIPEPSSLTLMILGLACTFVGARYCRAICQTNKVT